MAMYMCTCVWKYGNQLQRGNAQQTTFSQIDHQELDVSKGLLCVPVRVLNPLCACASTVSRMHI